MHYIKAESENGMNEVKTSEKVPKMNERKQCEINASVKEWLWRYRKAKLEVLRLESEYEEMRSVQESIKAITYSDMPKGSSSCPDLSRLMIARERLIVSLSKAKQNMLNVHLEIIEAIEKLDDNAEKDIMLLRYVCLKEGYGKNSIEEIADTIKYSPSFVKKKHGSALIKLGVITGIDTRKR